MTAEFAGKPATAVPGPDDRAMEAVADGDGDAFHDLFDRWKLPVMNFLYRSLGNFADAEDVTLEVFTEVWRSAPRYRSEGTFPAWLFAIARGKLRHEWRRRRRKPLVAAPVDSMEFPDTGNDSTVENREREEQLLKGLQLLPEMQRSALLLSVNSPLSSDEIARSLGVSRSHLYVIIHRARTRLQEIIRKDDHE